MPLDPARIPGYVKGQPPDPKAFEGVSYLDELETIWGRRWGAQSKIGRLKYALVNPPTENEASPETFEDPVIYGLADGPPDMEMMKSQFGEFTQALTDNGVELEYWEMPEVAESPYCRYRMLWAPASALVINGGAIIPRYGLAPWRRGFETLVTKKLASIGCPILTTIRDDGIMESGGNLIFLDPHHALVGMGPSGNEAGFRQLESVLTQNGVQEIHPVHFNGDIHLDLVFGLADAWLALVYPPGMDGKTMDYLRDKGLQLIEVSEKEHKTSACNIMAIEPGKVIMCERNVTVIEIGMSEFIKTGGGPHCATGCLIREPGPLLP